MRIQTRQHLTHLEPHGLGTLLTGATINGLIDLNDDVPVFYDLLRQVNAGDPTRIAVSLVNFCRDLLEPQVAQLLTHIGLEQELHLRITEHLVALV